MTKIMLSSLKKDASLASFEEWNKAGDYACEIRFFPHAFHCYQNAFNLDKNQEIAEKLNTIIDKVTNVLEVLPEKLKAEIEDFRLSNPLDPAKWLAVSNKLLKEENTRESFADYDPAKIALALCAYCSIRSGNDAEPVNNVLIQLVEHMDVKNFKSPVLEFDPKSKGEDPIRVVAFGDNATLGLQGPWEIKFRDTFHYQWSNETGEFLTLANCGVAGSGAMDALLFLKRDVLNYKPDITFLNFGMNDSWLGHQALLAYEVLMESVIELLKPHTQIVLISPVPHIPNACPERERPTEAPLKEVEIDSWHKAAKRVAAKSKVAFADLLAEFPADEEERKKYFVNEYNHLNKEGHTLIKNAVDKVFKFKA